MKRVLTAVAAAAAGIALYRFVLSPSLSEPWLGITVAVIVSACAAAAFWGRHRRGRRPPGGHGS